MISLDVPAERSGRLSDLLGTTWSSYWRLPHPVQIRSGGGYRPTTWEQLATLGNLDLDLSKATWFEVSGVRPHRSPRGADPMVQPLVLEPPTGPDGPWQQPIVDALVQTFGAATVHFARWTGYNDLPHDRSTPTGHELSTQRIAGRTYWVWSEQAWPAEDWAPNYAMPDSRDWVLCSDIDLMSSYVALRSSDTTAIWPNGYEVYQTLASAPLG